MSLADKIFGTYSDRELKKISSVVDQVMALEDKYSSEDFYYKNSDIGLTYFNMINL